MSVLDRIERLRNVMEQQKIDCYIIPTDDYHHSEYVGDYFKFREYITGFTGSASTAVFTKDKAGLWTDGRYFIQAEAQLKGSGITLYKSGESDVPTIEEFLKSELKEGDVLGFDGRTVTYAQGKRYCHIADENGASLKYRLDFALKKDSSPTPSTYYVFYKGQETEMMNLAFKKYLGVQMNKKDKPSIMKKLKHFKDAVSKGKNRERAREQQKDRGQSL